MNEGSNKLGIELSGNRKFQFQVVRLSEPGSSAENKSGTMEDYYVFDGDTEQPRMIRVVFASPLTLEEIDLGTAKGAETWKQIQSYLNRKNKKAE